MKELPATVNILLVEDDPSDAYLVQHTLDEVCPGEFHVKHVLSLEAALPLLNQLHFHVALLDLSLPGSSEMEALKTLQHAAPRLPVIILTGYNDEALATKAMQHGAQDYLVKERSDGHLIKRAIRYASHRKHFEDNLTQLANYDMLTGLANRGLFENRLQLALARTKRREELLAVLFIDLDRFKQVNDSLGHDAGDALLKQVGMRLKQCLREYDTVARFGGDEFAVLLESIGQAKDCQQVAQKMLDVLAPPFDLNGTVVTVGVSVGIAISAPAITMAELLGHADAAMYRAKAENISNWQVYTDHMHQELIERVRLEQDLAYALKRKDGFCLYYQPKLDIVSGKLAGAEALIRWEHPTRGLMAPAEFLPLMAGSAMEEELDIWVLETVCRDIQCWLAAGMKPIQVSIHVSAKQWQDVRMMDKLLAVLKKAGINSEYFAVEVDESAVLQKTSGDFDTLTRVRETGVEVHLDNFGADISSLKLLARCPIDVIKIDRRMMDDLNSREHHTTLIKALIDLGHQLGMKVVAEGVETQEQHTALAAMQCDEIQGMVISRPLSATDFFAWMGRRQRLAS